MLRPKCWKNSGSSSRLVVTVEKTKIENKADNYFDKRSLLYEKTQSDQPIVITSRCFFLLHRV